MKPQIVKQYVDTGKVRFVWHDFAWIGDESRQAAQASRCAARQGKYWEYHDILYENQRGENQGQFSDANLRQLAAQLGLDAGAFGSCLEKGEDIPAIQQDLTAARGLGIAATPVFIINGQRLAGAQSFDAFARLIDAALAKAG